MRYQGFIIHFRTKTRWSRLRRQGGVGAPQRLGYLEPLGAVRSYPLSIRERDSTGAGLPGTQQRRHMAKAISSLRCDILEVETETETTITVNAKELQKNYSVLC